MNLKKACLYVVATPIGNPRDITLRALDVLQEVDAVICEEYREGSTLLKRLGIQKEIILLNEHNEADQTQQILQRLFLDQSLALISDCGTPVFADPGAALISQLSQNGIAVVPVPGPSSLMSALSVADFKLDNFLFAGFLPRDRVDRRKALKQHRSMHLPVILMDAPYRLGAVLEDVEEVYGGSVPVLLAVDMTLPSETIFRGTVSDARKKLGQRKSEFVLIIH